jgi:hypothetical protein
MHVIAGNLTCAEFSQDGATLVTGDETGSLKFWGRMVITRSAFEAGQRRQTKPFQPAASPKQAQAKFVNASYNSGKPGVSRGTPSHGTAAAPDYRRSGPHEPKSERGNFAKPASSHSAGNFARPEPKVRQPENISRPQTQPHGGAQYQRAAEPTVKHSVDDVKPAMDGNPYELELERLLQKQQRQAEKMEKMGRCLECGKQLGFFAKIWGLKFCKKHGF